MIVRQIIPACDRIIICVFFLSGMFLNAYSQEREFVEFEKALSRIERFDLRRGPDKDVISRTQLSNLGSVQSYVRNSVFLAVANDYSYLDYCWLKAKDPNKRLAIGAVLISEHRADMDWHRELELSASRFEKVEREVRLRELQWISKNKELIAKVLSERVAASKETRGYLRGLQATLAAELEK